MARVVQVDSWCFDESSIDRVAEARDGAAEDVESRSEIPDAAWGEGANSPSRRRRFSVGNERTVRHG